jgi:Lar family restriction alleviation protein
VKEELKPCPFCGSEKLRVFEPLEGATGPLTSFWVSCVGLAGADCFAIGPLSTSRDEAIERWNRRNGDAKP